MKLSKQLKTKLDLIRLEGLCKFILNKYDEEELISKISKVDKSNAKSSKAIYKLSRKQLIQIIELSNFTKEEINNCYEEYRYGLRPGFSIYSFKSRKKISINQVTALIKEKSSELFNSIEEQPAIRDIKYNNFEHFKDEKLTEYSFYYSKKYSFINEEEEPAYIYELKETFVWISIENNFVAIKNCDERVVRMLISIFSQIYETELYPIILTEELVRKVFGNKRKKVSGVNIYASDKEPEKIIVSDPRLDEKEEIKKQLEPYTKTSEFLDINVDDVINTLGINNQKGKVHLTKNLSASSFRRWSIKTINEIIKYIEINNEKFEIFKAQNIMSNSRWTNYRKEEKNLIEEIIFKLKCFLENKKYNPIIQTKVDYSKLFKNFYNRVFINCRECNEICIPKCNCGGYDIQMTTSGNIICANCGETLDCLYCEEGHKVSVKNKENINAYLMPNLQLYNDIKYTLYEKFNIKFDGYFNIINNNLQIIKKSRGCLLQVEEINELNEVSKMVLDKDEREKLNKKMKKIKEKCTFPKKEDCNNCYDVDMCLLKLFTTYKGYRPGPHHGHEFGDVTFKATYKNEQFQFVGIAKSYCNLTRSCKSAREMLQQILVASQDKRVGIIGAICPARFDDQLISDIEYLAKCTQSKIVILDDVFMEKQLKNYNMKNNID